MLQKEMTRFVLINIFKLNSTEPGLLGVLLDEATRTTAQPSHVTITPTTIFAMLTGQIRLASKKVAMIGKGLDSSD